MSISCLNPEHPCYIIPLAKYDQVMTAAYYLLICAQIDPNLKIIGATREEILQAAKQAAREVTDNEEWIKWLEIAIPFCDDQIAILNSKDEEKLFA